MHGIFRQLLRSPRDFIGGNRGAVAILVAAMSIPLVGTTGLAIDTARGYLLKARMSQALDAAALAGGRVFFQPQRDADIQIYFDANFPPGFMHAELGTLQIAADKVVVILTDGYNQLYSAAKDYYGHSWFTDSDYTAHGRISAGRLGTTSNFTTARNQLNDRMAETCEAMKTEGIVIYTITFAVANNSGGNAIRDIFRDCATTPGYFFDSPSAEDLRETFRTIASQLSNLRIFKRPGDWLADMAIRKTNKFNLLALSRKGKLHV